MGLFCSDSLSLSQILVIVPLFLVKHPLELPSQPLVFLRLPTQSLFLLCLKDLSMEVVEIPGGHCCRLQRTVWMYWSVYRSSWRFEMLL